jgi:hypothetical protein
VTALRARAGSRGETVTVAEGTLFRLSSGLAEESRGPLGLLRRVIGARCHFLNLR